MNKAELVEAVQRELDVGRRDATEVVQGLFAAMAAALVRGERVKVNRFGLFVPKSRPARTLRDPRDGTLRALPARPTVGFRAAPRLKARLQAPGTAPSGRPPTPSASEAAPARKTTSSSEVTSPLATASTAKLSSTFGTASDLPAEPVSPG